MLQHRLRVEIGDQERDVVSLANPLATRTKRLKIQQTLTGFLLKTTKLSARCIMNLVNLWHKILSISSACLILMLTRMEFTEGSISTRSFSFLEIVSGLRRTSFDVLCGVQNGSAGNPSRYRRDIRTRIRLLACYVALPPVWYGLLCRRR